MQNIGSGLYFTPKKIQRLGWENILRSMQNRKQHSSVIITYKDICYIILLLIFCRAEVYGGKLGNFPSGLLSVSARFFI